MTFILILFGVFLLLKIWSLLSCRYSIRNRKLLNSYAYKDIDIPRTTNFNIYELWTEDGYRLQIFHLRDEERFDPSLNPVIMHHSLGGSAENWLFQGKEKSPAVILTREGY